MKPVSFFRGGWRRKENKSTSSSSPSVSSSPSSSRPGTSSAISMVPMQHPESAFPLRTTQEYARSDVSVPYSQTYDQRKRTYSANASVSDSISSRTPPTPPKPQRPRRPPGLTISTDPFPRDEDDGDLTPRPPFSAPPQSKKSTPRPSYRRSRSELELDGIWQGFVAELEEDFDFLDLHSVENSPEKLHRRCFSRRDRPSTSPLDKTSPPSRVPHPFSRSMSNLSSPSRAVCHEPMPIRSPAKRAPITVDTISLFPNPPPLNIRRGKALPKPLVLPSSPAIPLPPASPSVSTPDTTPVATPTTPRFCQSPGSPHRDLPTPPSILKKRPTTSSSSHPSIDAGTSPTMSPPRSPSKSTFVPSPSIRPLRLAQSASNFHIGQPKHSASHKATFSESQTLDRRRNQNTMCFPPQGMYSEPQQSYLQSKGRTRPANSHQQPAIRWGHVV